MVGRADSGRRVLGRGDLHHQAGAVSVISTAVPGRVAGGRCCCVPLGQHGHSGGHGDAAVADPGFGAVDSPSARQSMFERGERQKQLVVANGVATKYPTVAEAEKAGLRRALTYVPGTGAIYYDPKVISGDFSTFDASKPGAWSM